MDAPTFDGINVPEWKGQQPLEPERAPTMQITTIGIDLAKNVFQIHVADQRGKAVLRKQLRRDHGGAVLRELVAVPDRHGGLQQCPPLGAQASGAGHTVLLMAPQFVNPYVKSNKNEVADAEAICEAVSRPTMRFVPIKNAEQQSVLSLHRVRQAFVKARTAKANQIRGLLAEYGLIVPKGIGFIATRVPDLIEDASNELQGLFRQLIDRLLEHLKLLDQQVDEIEVQIKAWHRGDETSQKLQKVPGIGPITASALAATVGNAKNFDNGRQLAAWLGLVPRQNSSGGKQTLLGMSKHGDAYLRTLLIHGARSVLYRASQKNDTESWLVKFGNSAQRERCCGRPCQQDRQDRVGLAGS